MPSHPALDAVLLRLPTSAPEETFTAAVVPLLVDRWLRTYNARTPSCDVVETAVGGFCFLFDLKAGRLIAAWGISHGRHGAPRDKTRMAGHPLGAGPGYHRGHAIPHTLGGPTDINLVPQLGAINIGPFRALEKEAVATPGALYFTHWRYGASDGQRPLGVEQGLLRPGQRAQIRRHGN